MTATYKLVQWNRHKRVYDVSLTLACTGYLATFVAVGLAMPEPGRTVGTEVLAMRALGTLAIVLLHLILIIGPAARLTTLAAPLLYNRRHLGVTFFFVALTHAIIAIGYYGGFGVRNPISSVLAGYASYGSASRFPFEVLGFAGLLIFFVMAATSHDFWLAILGARFWKTLHMLVYVAYALVIAHVALGPLQSEPSPVHGVLLILGVVTIGTFHIAAGIKELRTDSSAIDADDQQWIDVADVGDLDDNTASVVCLRSEERIALVRHDGSISAVSNVCAHQGGPLGEGRVIDGCLTCPWHGYQYRPADGRSPPPYTERLATYAVRIEGTRVMVNPKPNAPGTRVEPARIAGSKESS